MVFNSKEKDDFMAGNDFISAIDEQLKLNIVFIDEKYISLLRDSKHKENAINLKILLKLIEFCLGVEHKNDDYSKYNLGKLAEEK